VLSLAVRLRQNALGARVSGVEERLLEPSANTAYSLSFQLGFQHFVNFLSRERAFRIVSFTVSTPAVKARDLTYVPPPRKEPRRRDEELR